VDRDQLSGMRFQRMISVSRFQRLGLGWKPWPLLIAWKAMPLRDFRLVSAPAADDGANEEDRAGQNQEDGPAEKARV
jgi:hypothetical protein